MVPHICGGPWRIYEAASQIPIEAWWDDYNDRQAHRKMALTAIAELMKNGVRTHRYKDVVQEVLQLMGQMSSRYVFPVRILTRGSFALRLGRSFWRMEPQCILARAEEGVKDSMGFFMQSEVRAAAWPHFIASKLCRFGLMACLTNQEALARLMPIPSGEDDACGPAEGFRGDLGRLRRGGEREERR